MTTKTFTTTVDYLDRLILRAPSLDARIEADPDLTEAVLELAGPEEIVAQATVERTAIRWVLTLPEQTGPTMVVTNSVTGNGHSVSVVAGNIGPGTVLVGGTTFTGTAVQTTGGEPVRATVRVPAGVDLEVPGLCNGAVRARGTYGWVGFDSTNADLDLDYAVCVDAETTNGDITVGGARECLEASSTNGDIDLEGTAPSTRARSTNGDIDITASGAHRIRARATNGDVTVRRNGHTGARISAETTNGRDRIR